MHIQEKSTVNRKTERNKLLENAKAEAALPVALRLMDEEKSNFVNNIKKLNSRFSRLRHPWSKQESSFNTRKRKVTFSGCFLGGASGRISPVQRRNTMKRN